MCEECQAYSTQLRVHGEDVLDEALAFTTTHLESAVPNLSNHLQEQVIHALNQPIHHSLTSSPEFCKIIFQLIAKKKAPMGSKGNHKISGGGQIWTLQINYLLQETIVECYFWMLDEPQYFLARKILFRVTALTSIIDDIYDVYGTLEEHVLFTDAVERWEISALDQLPEYMNLCYQALLDIYNMMDKEMAKQGRSYCVDYAKSMYMHLALLTCGYCCAITPCGVIFFLFCSSECDTYRSIEFDTANQK
ncbi:unnamed protein product [Camellia sinensis]